MTPVSLIVICQGEDDLPHEFSGRFVLTMTHRNIV